MTRKIQRVQDTIAKLRNYGYIKITPFSENYRNYGKNVIENKRSLASIHFLGSYILFDTFF